MKRQIKYLLLILLISCSTSPEQLIKHIDGYWEITSVQKNNALVKEYKISNNIDYFEVKNDLTGFRKKVMPTFKGTYIVTQHISSFLLKIENDSLNIYYTNNELTTKETIVKASTSELIIINSEGFKYTYKPYEKIDIN